MQIVNLQLCKYHQMLQKKKKAQSIPIMDQILVYSEKLNKSWLEVHFVEGKTSDVTMNAILTSAKKFNFKN